MAVTQNFGLYKPNRTDSLEVDVTLTQNFEKIDTELFSSKSRLDHVEQDLSLVKIPRTAEGTPQFIDGGGFQTPGTKIQARRGNKLELPLLDNGEFGVATDTKEFYVGLGYENIPITSKKQLDLKSISSVMEFGAIGDGASHPVSEKFSTLEEAQAYFGTMSRISSRNVNGDPVYVNEQICTSLTDELDLCAIRKALSWSNPASVVIIPYGKTFIVNNFFSIKGGKRVFAVGMKIKAKTGAIFTQGHIVAINGFKGDINNALESFRKPIPDVDIVWEGGTIDGDGAYKTGSAGTNGGLNGFGIEAAESILISNVHITNCKRDTVVEGGRGITFHAASRNVTVINTRISKCSTGLDTSTKADYIDNDPSNGTAELDTYHNRTRNINFIDCLIEECEYSGFNVEQANNPTNIEMISQDVSVQNCQFINCGSNWTNRGIINGNKATNVRFTNCTVYNDAAHPIDSVFRGSFHKSIFTGVVQVDTLNSLINPSPVTPVSGVDQGDMGHPNGTMEENEFDLKFHWTNVTTALIAGTDFGGTSIDYCWRNFFKIRLYNEAQFTKPLVSGLVHSTNVAEVHDAYDNRYARFRFNLVKALSSTWLD